MRDQCIFPGVPTSVRFRHLSAEIGPEWNYVPVEISAIFSPMPSDHSFCCIISSPRSTHLRSQCNQIDEIPNCQPRLRRLSK
eukprot:COSAG02_NODE_5302_length_4458_cov_32.131682_2_plen_82_part_00